MKRIRKILRFSRLPPLQRLMLQVKRLIWYKFKIDAAIYYKKKEETAHYKEHTVIVAEVENLNFTMSGYNINLKSRNQIFEIRYMTIEQIETWFVENLPEDKLVFYKTNQREKRIKEILCS